MLNMCLRSTEACSMYLASTFWGVQRGLRSIKSRGGQMLFRCVWGTSPKAWADFGVAPHQVNMLPLFPGEGDTLLCLKEGALTFLGEDLEILHQLILQQEAFVSLTLGEA